MYKNGKIPELSPEEVSLDKLGKGESAKVKRLITEDSKSLQKLLALGIIPGRILRVLQRTPVYILEIEHTQVAIDKKLASKIILKR
jgi:Fe2+ transport system protein FeoA